ncbi:MAG: hypothetical protein ACPGVG_06145 [Mycobacterium sp.]
MAVTFASLMDEFSQAVEIVDRDFQSAGGVGGASNSTVANIAALDAVTEDTPRKARKLAAMAQARRSRSAALTPWVKTWFREWCTDFAEFIDAPASGFAAIPYIWKYFHDNSQAVARRNFTRGSVSWTTSTNSISASNVVSISTDRYGYAIEDGPRYDSTDSDIVHEWLCRRDPQTGSPLGEFVHRLAGDPPYDALSDASAYRGSTTVAVVDGGGGNLIKNGLFEASFSGTGQSKVPSWYIDAQEGSVTADTTSGNGYRWKLNTVTPDNTGGDYAQILLAYNATAQPKLTQYVTQRLLENVPYMIGVTFKGTDGTADGNMTLTVGSKSASTSVSTSWKHLFIHASNEEYAWYDQFAADPLPVEIQRTGSPTAGSVSVHAVYFYPFRNYHAGRYSALIAGTDEYRKDDKASATDAVGNSTPAGSNQYWWNRWTTDLGVEPQYVYLPSAASATTHAHDYS